jgi:hypothetical protein
MFRQRNNNGRDHRSSKACMTRARRSAQTSAPGRRQSERRNASGANPKPSLFYLFAGGTMWPVIRGLYRYKAYGIEQGTEQGRRC